METLNTYNIQINNLKYKQAIALKEFLHLQKIPAKITIVELATKKIKYNCYISKFDK